MARDWFGGAAPTLAPQLLNKVLVSRVDGTTVTGRIVEVEAYTESDPASHTFGGRTDRNSAMFGRAGHLYVYLSYGIHVCGNVVCGPVGSGQAVLVRAVIPLDGIETMRTRRVGRPDRELVNGPGKVGQAFGFDLSHDGLDLTRRSSLIRIIDDGVLPPSTPVVGPRIGLTKAVDTEWRFRVP